MKFRDLTLVGVDFETYYDQDYSLSKLSLSDYIQDERFLAQLAAVKVGDGAVHVCRSFDEAREYFKAINWSKSALVAHNTLFDGFILTQVFGHRPKFYLDTLAMARARYPFYPSHSLAYMLKELKLGHKDTKALESMKGRREIPPELMDDFCQYAADDLEGCLRLLQRFLVDYPPTELDLISLFTRMFCEPVLEVDLDRADKELKREILKKETLTKAAGVEDRGELLSNDQFAEKLLALGVDIPMKVSKLTKRETWPFAKTDAFMKALGQHHDPVVRSLAEARLAVKSTIGETRAAAFIQAGNRGLLPAGYKYWGAHTGRPSGANKINLMNLKRGGELRKSILAPPGHQVVVCDSAQIEARFTAKLANCTTLLDGFRNMRKGSPTDIYTSFASDVYQRAITKADELERHVGKTCILGLGYGMGANRLRETLASGQNGPVIHLPISDCQRIVNLYRERYVQIPGLWHEMDEVLRYMIEHRGKRLEPGEQALQLRHMGCVRTAPPLPMLWLPSGMFLYYTGLAYDDAGKPCYRQRGGVTGLYGGKMTENAAQALARIAVTDQMLEIDRHYRVVMMTYDEIATIAPDHRAQDCLDLMVDVMSKSPVWCPDIPLAAEGKFAKYYSK